LNHNTHETIQLRTQYVHPPVEDKVQQVLLIDIDFKDLLSS